MGHGYLAAAEVVVVGPIVLVCREASLSLAKIAFCPKRLPKLLKLIDNVALVSILYRFAPSALKKKFSTGYFFLRAYEVAEPLIAGVHYTTRLGRRISLIIYAKRSMNERAPVYI